MSADLVVPATGELLDLDGPTDVLADAVARIASLETDLRDARSALRGELLRRMDTANVRSFDAGPYKLEAEAPNQSDYDAQDLAPVLAELVVNGKIAQEAMDAALERVVSHKPRKRELDRLLTSPTLSDEDRAAIQACAKPRTRERRLTVKAA